MKINQNTIDKLSVLAKLEFTTEQKAKLENDLERILGFVDTLNKVDTKGVEPLIYLSDEVNSLRKDVAQNQISHEQAMRNAPKKDSDYFKLPKVIES